MAELERPNPNEFAETVARLIEAAKLVDGYSPLDMGGDGRVSVPISALTRLRLALRDWKELKDASGSGPT